MAETAAALRQKISELEAEVEDRQNALPAHSIRPHQLLEIEALENEIADLKARLAKLES